MTKPARTPIAIVGASALFPGSLDATGFWSNILHGNDLITDVPASHWLIEDYYDPDPSKPDKTYARRGAFLPHIDFDAMRWGVPPSIVPETDTSQLLALIVAQRVLEDASKGAPETLDRSRTSVILGVTSGQELLGSMVSRLQRPVWVRALREAGIPESEVTTICDRISASYTDWKESTFPGLLGNVVAGRIANRLDLGGTNCVSDAACASSMSALSMGINELLLGDSDLVISGGVDTMNDIFMFMCFSKTPALSASGDCRPFSENADGTMLGEGLGMVALKRLEDAQRDGDRIYGVIHGCGSSSDGRSKSVYAPVSSGQANALRRAYGQAGYGPETVELIEAHGTGTRAGDKAEFGGLEMVFEETGREDRQWCQLGSVKSQIGHTKSAAGAAGLLKALMAVHHRVLPPTIKVERPNPGLDLPKSAFHITTRARPWVRNPEHPRRASVSAFGFGGSNFHVALEEAPGSETGRGAPRLPAQGRELVVLAADSASALVEQAKALVERCSKPGALAWEARGAERTRTGTHRLAIVAPDEASLAAQLQDAITRIELSGTEPFSTPAGTRYGHGPVEGDVAFVFPGQGSQYVDMGAQLAMQFDAALGVWDQAAATGMRLHDAVFPITDFEPDADARAAARLAATDVAQPAIGCTSLSLLTLLRSVGLEAACVAGHSFGEVTALHAAGVIDTEAFLRVAQTRGATMAEAASTPGAMTAVSATVEVVREALAGLNTDVVVANHNAPEQVVLSGKTPAIEAVEAALGQQGLRCKRLPVATAFHSEVVAGASQTFAAAIADVDMAAATIPVFANASAQHYPSEPAAIRDQLAAQLAQPVRFVEMIDAMYAEGVRTFVEVGPGSVLTGLIGRILGDRPHRALHLDRKGRDGVRTLLEGLATLVADGHALQLDALWEGYAAPLDPAATPDPKVSLSLSGANYGKPYPPARASDNPPPNPERVETPVSQPAVAVAPTPEPKPAPRTPEPTVMRPSDSAPPVVVPSVSIPSVQVEVELASSAPISEGWGALWEETQRQTAQVHAAYLDAMAQSHSAYLQTVERSMAMLSGAPVVESRTSVPAMAQAVVAQPIAPAPVAAPPVVAAPQSVPVAPSQPAPVAEAPAPVAADPAAAAAPALDLQAVMTAVVSEKTGYPPEMLSAEMNLEADLGIDSIKRVEILSAVQDAAPAMPEVDPNALAKLQTLGEIVAHMQSLMGPVSAPVAAAPAAPSVDLHAVMTAVVADKTGYPPEMLSAEMNLEADLGIDSIKRVEILSAVQDAAPDMPEVDPNALAKLQTLGEIVEHMQSLMRGSPATAAAAPVTAAAPSSELGRFVLRAVPEPAPGLTLRGFASAGLIAVTDDGAGVAAALVDALTRRGASATLWQDGAALPAGARGLILLDGLQSVDAASSVEFHARAFERAKALGSATQPSLLVTVQDTGGAFGTSGLEPSQAWVSGLPGLARTANQEWAQASVKALDVQRGSRAPAEVAAAIVDELLQGGNDLDVGLAADGTRVVLQSVPEVAQPEVLPLQDGAVIVASGGARGVTAATLIALAAHGAYRFALLGRTPLAEESALTLAASDDASLKRALLQEASARGESVAPAELGKRAKALLAAREVRATLDAIAAAGSTAEYVPVSVTDAPALTAALDGVRAKWGRIDAVVHAAGVLADRKIEDKTRDQFDLVFSTKVAGLHALLTATAGDALKLLIMFSSVAARYGNTGQVDYAMANEVLNKVAWSYAVAHPQCRVKSLGWGPWKGGMVTPQLEQHFAAMGVALIPLETGAQMMLDEIQHTAADTVELVLGGAPAAGAFAPAEASDGVRVDVVVDRESHPFLVDHSIAGTPVVPVAFAVEWFSRAARAACPGLKLAGLHDVSVLRGISLKDFDSKSTALHVHTVREAVGGTTQLGLELRDDAGNRYYRARATMAAKLPAAPSAPSTDLGLQTWGDRTVYDGSVLFHGPDFQVIRSIDGVSDKGIAANVAGVREAGWQSPWCTDPLAVDGGLQLALLWSQHMLGGSSLPTAIGEVKTYATPAEGPLRCTLTGRRAEGQKAVADVVFHDQAGTVVAELYGVETHQLPRA